MCGSASLLARLGVATLLALATAAAPAAGRFGLGTLLTDEQIAGWDIDVRPDGQGLPRGQGTAEEGEELYVEKCASCHGEFGEATGRYPVLMGGGDTLAGEDPVKTVGSYWPYATTVFDYVRRAMPFGHAQSLSDDETYAITAFVLSLSEIVESDEVMNAQTLPRVQMPNREGFVRDDRPDTPTGDPCMSDCLGERTVVGRARVIDVTPEAMAPEPVSVATAGGDAVRGREVFSQCQACHSMSPGQHLMGPSLHGIVGRRAGTVEDFPRYSEAIRASGVEWTEENLKRFLTAPQGFVAGTSMPFAGISSKRDLEDVVRYLTSPLD